jgi:hypothetical protein
MDGAPMAHYHWKHVMTPFCDKYYFCWDLIHHPWSSSFTVLGRLPISSVWLLECGFKESHLLPQNRTHCKWRTSSTKFIEKSNNDLCVCFVCMALLLLVVSSANLVVHDKFDGKILACVEFYGNLISNSRTSRFWWPTLMSQHNLSCNVPEAEISPFAMYMWCNYNPNSQ